MSAYIENIYHEINLTETTQDVKKTLSAIVKKIVEIETMLSTSNIHINKNDNASVESSLRGTTNQSNKPLNELFCENFIIFAPIEDRYLHKLNNNNEKEEFKSSDIPKELLGNTTAKIKFAFNHIGLPISKQQIKPTRIKYNNNENYKNQPTNYIQTLKIVLDLFESDKVIENHSNQENLNS